MFLEGENKASTAPLSGRITSWLPRKIEFIPLLTLSQEKKKGKHKGTISEKDIKNVYELYLQITGFFFFLQWILRFYFGLKSTWCTGKKTGHIYQIFYTNEAFMQIIISLQYTINTVLNKLKPNSVGIAKAFPMTYMNLHIYRKKWVQFIFGHQQIDKNHQVV